MHPDPDAPDSAYADYDPTVGWQFPDAASEYGGSEMYDDPGSAMPSDMPDYDGEEGEEGDEGEYDDEDGDDGFDELVCLTVSRHDES